MAVPKLRFKGFISDWDSRKFSDTLSFLGTNSFSRDNMNLVSGSVKNIHYGDILVIYGNVLDTSCEQIPFVNEDVNISKIKEKDYLLSGDVIIADTAEDYTVGKATEIINSKGIKIIAGLHTQACRPKRKFAVGYLGNFVNSLAFRKQIRRIAQGTKVLSIIKKYIEDTEIHFPIEKEQQKISDFLTTFDKRITAQKNIVADLEETKKGLLQKIFSQEIRFKDDNGQDYPDWKESTIGNEGYFYYGKSAPKWSITDDAQTPCIRYGELYTTHYYEVKEIKSYTNIERKNLRFSKGNEVLVPRVGEDPLDFHRCAYLPFKDVAIGEMISVYNTENNPLFISYCFNATMKYKFARVVEGGNVSNLYYSYLENIGIGIPCREEQDKIAEYFSTFDKKITAEKQILSDLQEMKKGLLQQMFV